MIHFSKNTIKNAQLVYRVKDQLRDILDGYEIEEVDLLNFADEFTASGLDYRVLLRTIVTDPIYGRSK